MKTSNYSDLEHLELVAGRIAESGVDITTQYEDWICVTFACASLGEQAREYYHVICRNYPGYSREECDEKFDNCVRTGDGRISIATLMQKAKEAGIDVSLPRGRRPKNEEQKGTERENRFQQMRRQLTEWYDFRFNVWRNRVELREKPDGVWSPMNDRDFSTLFTRLHDAGIPAKMSDLDALLKSRDFSRDYDAVNEWLDSLEPWNPDTDPDYLTEFFAGHLKYSDPENNDFYQRMLTKWFVGMVALWKGLANENPIMPVVCGPQHIGKTYFIRHILPLVLRSYFKEPSPRDPVDKDFIISLAEVVMIFLDEFSISSNMKSDTYKAIITSTQSNMRDVFAHFRELRQRKASLIGATNHKQFIFDAEGNRRYVGIDLAETVNLNERPLPYEGAYAQALWLLKNGFDPKPTQEDSAEITEHNKAFMVPNDCEEALMTFLRHPKQGDMVEAMTVGELMKELGIWGFRGKEYNAVNVGRAMKRLGFEQIRGRRYKVVIAKPEQQLMERKIQA